MLPPQTISVAVTGIAEAGKTTFLASLMWHLEQYGTGKFKAKNNKDGELELSQFKFNEDLPPAHIFNFKNVISQMLHDKAFPQKTTDWKECNVSFERSDWEWTDWWWMVCPVGRTRQRIAFTDFPGERVADISLMHSGKYNQWCGNFFSAIDNVPQLLPYVNKYKSELEEAHDNESLCLKAYKTLVAECIQSYGHIVSPSTLLLDEKGEHYRKKINFGAITAPAERKEKFITTAISGKIGEEFVPIPVDTNHPLKKTFGDKYATYYKTVIQPLERRISNADILLVLVSLPNLLREGDVAYNSAVTIMENLVATFNEKYSFFNRKIIFVGTQTDRVHPDDIKNNNYEKCLGHAVGGIKKNLKKSVKLKVTTCSAIKSTTVANIPRHLIATAKQDSENRAYNPGEVPDDIPEKFSKDMSLFPNVPGAIPSVITKPPAHDKLDTIFNLIIN